MAIEDSKGNKKNKTTTKYSYIAHSQHGNCIGGLEQRVVLLSIYLVPAEEETRKRKKKEKSMTYMHEMAPTTTTVGTTNDRYGC